MDPPAVDDYLSISNLGRRSKDAPAPALNTPKSFPLGFRPCQGLLLLIRHSLFWFCPLSLHTNTKAQAQTPREVKSKQKTSAMAAPKGRSRRLEGRSRRLDRAFCSVIIYTIMSFFVLVYLDGGGHKR
eukprot:scaffold2485_cov143-Skeletonema_dohrnii-CCMP3373.AAC.4